LAANERLNPGAARHGLIVSRGLRRGGGGQSAFDLDQVTGDIGWHSFGHEKKGQNMATLRTKQISVVTMSTIAFTVCFAVWMMFAVIGIPIKKTLGLNETQFGLLAATPVLTGSLIRLEIVPQRGRAAAKGA
jgi:hypothetical protein